eukprot:Platyproteum_vivax@DN1040_c0_g1_i1.p3
MTTDMDMANPLTGVPEMAAVTTKEMAAVTTKEMAAVTTKEMAAVTTKEMAAAPTNRALMTRTMTTTTIRLLRRPPPHPQCKRGKSVAAVEFPKVLLGLGVIF